MKTLLKCLAAVVIGTGFVWLFNRGLEMMNTKDTLVVLGGLMLNTALVVGAGTWIARKAKKLFAPITMLLGLALIGSTTTGCTRIGPGYGGIKVSMAGTNRGVEDMPVTTGWVFYNPLGSNVYEWPLFVQTVVWTHNVDEGNPINEEITFTNADQMQIAVDVSMAYHLESAKLPYFFVKFRSDNMKQFTDGYLRSLARDKFNEAAGKYHIEQIMGDNGPFIAEVKSALQRDLEPYGVVLEAQFGIIGAPRPPASVVESINMKLQAVQIAQQKQNEVVQAEADARKAVAKADGEAKSILVVAEAQAAANRKIADSVTTNLIQYKQLEKWNGTLPQITGGAVPFINLQSK
jgi:regulator of protease activity HflC (stomatin/prohibitin superfamily)